jgi:hypothetical protein
VFATARFPAKAQDISAAGGLGREWHTISRLKSGLSQPIAVRAIRPNLGKAEEMAGNSTGAKQLICQKIRFKLAV